MIKYEKRQIVLWSGMAGIIVSLLYSTVSAAGGQIRLKTAMEKYHGRYRILYETYRVNNFEIFVMDPDGSNQKNLTNTPDVHEFYPRAAPDGKTICFMAYQGQDENKIRCLYLMNSDGSNRRKIVERGRWPCWSPDGKQIAFVKEYLPRFSIKDYATEGLYFYDITNGQITEHPNKEIKHAYNLTWHKNSRWIAAVVHGGMGLDHAIIALETKDNRTYKLLDGNRCRPEFSPDGLKITWCDLDWAIGLGNLRLYNNQLNVTAYRQIAASGDHKGVYLYHPDFSPDGKFIAFSRGPVGPENPVDTESPGTDKAHHAAIGARAKGWNICVVSTQTGQWIKLTTEGHSNKEPDWIKVVDAPAKLR